MNDNTLIAIVKVIIGILITVVIVALSMTGGTWDSHRKRLHECVDTGTAPKVCIDTVMR